jgi:NAD(P) transhydrogenase subunit alpha
MDAMAIISIFVLAVFVGFEVVSKVSSTLHTPLMSGANAIHGVILVGAIIVADHSKTNLELGLSLLQRLFLQQSIWSVALLLPTECSRCLK